MARKDKNDTQIFQKLFNLDYQKSWDSYTSNEEINEILKTASKKQNGERGYPDLIYVNENRKLLILGENKNSISKHESSEDNYEPVDYAVDGIKWYLDQFTNIDENYLSEYFNNWNILGLAISGDLEDDYNHKITTFAILKDRQKTSFIQKIEELENIDKLMNEEEYISLFKNIDEEITIKHISASSKKINQKLRFVDSQKRPVLLSALMISLFEIKNGGNSFIVEFNQNTSEEIVGKLIDRVDSVLKSENIPKDKRDILKAGLEFIKVDKDLNDNDKNILKDILNELRNIIIPLFAKETNYDIVGKFYQEFLRFAGVANVKKGIVLTPHHITGLFTDLIDIKEDDVCLDSCCGTGSFLISFMNKVISLKKEKEFKITNKLIRKLEDLEADDSVLVKMINFIQEENNIKKIDKEYLIEKISETKVKNKDNIKRKIQQTRNKQLSKQLRDLKSKQLIGFEKNTTMYSLAVSNMLFRGDGKSQIYNVDYFDKIVKYNPSEKDIKHKTTEELNKERKKHILDRLEMDGIKPTIGFINPPYGGRDSKSKPTKKEIQFLGRLLDHVSRYAIMIAPLSSYFKDQDFREQILKKHTLKYIINMPSELFEPNASTHTAITVFEANKPHDYNKDVIMYNLKDDGFVLSKSKGRTNLYNKWDDIKADLLKKLNDPTPYVDNIDLVKTAIKSGDEWLIQAHSQTDYSNLNEDDFLRSIKENMAFQVKKDMDLIDKDINKIDFINLLASYYSENITCNNCNTDYDIEYDFCPFCGSKKELK